MNRQFVHRLGEVEATDMTGADYITTGYEKDGERVSLSISIEPLDDGREVSILIGESRTFGLFTFRNTAQIRALGNVLLHIAKEGK